MRCWIIVLATVPLSSCATEEKLFSLPLKGGIEAVISVARRGASAQNTARVSLKDILNGQSVEIFSGKGGSDPKISLLPGNQIVVAYCGATEIKAMSYLYSVGENLRFTDIRVIVATSIMEIQGKVFC